MKKEIIFMIGIPGSGKSFYVKEINKFNKYKVISSDEIRLKKYGNNFSKETNNKVFDEFHKIFIHSMKNNENIILDATNLYKKDRKKNFDLIDKEKYNVYAVNFEIDKNKCIDNIIKRELYYRNNNINNYIRIGVNKKELMEIVNRMNRFKHQPTKEEGFDGILNIYN